jgi:hypothetical protein
MSARSVLAPLGAFGSALVGAPWWCVTTCIFGFLLLRAVQTVFPQNSADRLKWWNDFWRRPARGQSPDAAPPATVGTGTPPASSTADPARTSMLATGSGRSRAPRGNPPRRRRPSRTPPSQPPRAGPV